MTLKHSILVLALAWVLGLVLLSSLLMRYIADVVVVLIVVVVVVVVVRVAVHRAFSLAFSSNAAQCCNADQCCFSLAFNDYAAMLINAAARRWRLRLTLQCCPMPHVTKVFAARLINAAAWQ